MSTPTSGEKPLAAGWAPPTMEPHCFQYLALNTHGGVCFFVEGSYGYPPSQVFYGSFLFVGAHKAVIHKTLGKKG